MIFHFVEVEIFSFFLFCFSAIFWDLEELMIETIHFERE